MVYINYVTKWVEASALTQPTKEQVEKFLYNKILQRFVVPRTIISYQGPQFMSKVIIHFKDMYQVTH